MVAEGKGVGISGFALYTPPFKVSLERWCEWTGNPWDKVSAVVGRSFRQPGAHESIYTMAANAVLRLIEQYDIDPDEVGFLGFGTESSTDNSAGAVIVQAAWSIAALERCWASRRLSRELARCRSSSRLAWAASTRSSRALRYLSGGRFAGRKLRSSSARTSPSTSVAAPASKRRARARWRMLLEEVAQAASRSSCAPRGQRPPTYRGHGLSQAGRRGTSCRPLHSERAQRPA